MKKKLLSLILISLFYQTTFAHETHEIEDRSSVLTYEAEEQYLNERMGFKSLFPQTTWRECDDYVTGNYTGYNCSNKRGISVILKTYMENHFLVCTNEALKNYNGKSAIDLHVTHDGIQGDANHSPKSLHAEARAIDVDSLVITYSGGVSERLKFKGSTHQSFFNSFRTCWGRKVNSINGCPLINGNPSLTGSIGKEDGNHQNHLHVSVPYCVNGAYSTAFYKR